MTFWLRWKTNKNNDSDSNRYAIRPCRNLDEVNHLQFVNENLTEILELFVESTSVKITEAVLDPEFAKALDLIIEGSSDKLRSVKPFSVILRTQFPRTTHITLRAVHKWLRSSLGSNPFDLESCILKGRRLQWRLFGDFPSLSDGELQYNLTPTPDKTRPSMKRQKIATNAHLMLRIYKAFAAQIYLLSPLRSVTLNKCKGCVIVLGPVESTLQVRLSANLNLWDKPFVIGGQGIAEGNKCWSLMPPDDFFPFNIPVIIPSSQPSSDEEFTVEEVDQLNRQNLAKLCLERPKDYSKIFNVISLPKEYAAALQQRAAVFQKYHHNLKNANFSPRQLELFSTVMKAKFDQWLDDTNQKDPCHLLEFNNIYPPSTEILPKFAPMEGEQRITSFFS
ncbi:TBCC domain-containing protein 1 [Cichlidogyrus casuarinus]|uniref:TBCC domain-containing protein 1 n=1 Tax=Cichlidogyrus casuarinus TaxID=1844966 RepID=A0ABD2QA45_9PLAT